MRVATYSARGMLAGKLHMLRKVQGPQFWRVVIKIRNGNQEDEHTIRSTGRCDLTAMKDYVISSINELLPPGATVNDASMNFFCEAR